MDGKMKVVIVGGGIAGLASAYYLNQKAKQEGRAVEITVLEKADYWGGKIKTIVEDGFVVEGGPDAYLVTKPWMRALVRDLGLEDGLHGTSQEHTETFILHKGKLTSIPAGLTMTIPTEFGPLLKTRLMTFAEKARMGLDFLIPPQRENGDESLAGFISRRLGRAAYDNLVGPLLSGIYAGDGDRLSLMSTFPNLREMELDHGGLIKGALALKLQRTQMAVKGSNGQKAAKSRSIFETHQKGLAHIVETLVENLEEEGVDLRLSSEVKQVLPQEGGYRVELVDGEQIFADGLVLSAPAYASAVLLEDVLPDLAVELSGVDYVTTATVSLAFRREMVPGLKGYGYIIPQHEDSKALACTWTSTKWAKRAPDDYALLRVFIGRIQDADKLPEDEDQLVALARGEIRQTMGIEIPPEKSWVFRWERAMPQYNLGHPERLERIESIIEQHPALALAGNGYSGIGMPDCIRSGIEAAEKMLEIKEKVH
jgi:oxygen-dependent protoporphyrinogen oxidase